MGAAAVRTCLLLFSVAAVVAPSHCRMPPQGPGVDLVGLVLAGRFHLSCVLGRGSFGVVYGAVDGTSSQKVAVKLIECQSFNDRDKKEIAIMTQIVHPNVVRLLDVCQTNEAVGIVMELCPSDLFDRIELCGWFEEEEATEYFQMLCEGVDSIHDFGIAHRDLKPENLLLDSCGTLKITDFGLSSQAVDRNNNPRLFETACGTIQYVPPEALTGQPYDGFMGDNWALGVILFIMVAGRFPFAQATTQCNYYREYLEGKLEVQENCSTELMDLLKGILAPDFTSRMTLADIMQAPWLNSDDAMEEDSIYDDDIEPYHNAKSPQPLPLPRAKPRRSKGNKALSGRAEEAEWETEAPDGVKLKRTDFKRVHGHAKLRLQHPPPAALSLLQEVASGGDLSIVGGVTITEVWLEGDETLCIVGGCDGLSGQEGSSVTMHVQAEEASDDCNCSELTFYRFQGDTMSYRTILLALRSNLVVQLAMSSVSCN